MPHINLPSVPGFLRYLTFALAASLTLFVLAACGSEPAPAAAPTAAVEASPTEAMADTAAASDTIKVGILHSLSGTMAISETAVRDAEMLAISEINAAGGVMGKQLEVVIEDGASDWPTFAEKARKLLQNDEVAVVFGGWTSASRKAMLPVFESNNGLLFYPVQYEGLESSPNIFYTGATTNQQIVPAIEYLLAEGKTKFYLLGSDYVFPRTSNLIINKQLEAAGLTAVGEEYTPLGHTEYSTVISKIRAAEPDVVFNTLNGDSNVAFFKQLKDAGISAEDEEYTPLGHTEYSTVISKIRAAEPDVVFNTLNGDSNVAFFKQLKDAGISAEDLPTVSVSVAEEEITGIGAENITGHLVAWNYFQTTDTPANAEFVAAFKAAIVLPTTPSKPGISEFICGRPPLRPPAPPTSPP